LFERLHPGQRYYLTNIQAAHVEPTEVRNWSTDLWLFPYYTDADQVPYDVQEGGPAAGDWPDPPDQSGWRGWKAVALVIGGLALVSIIVLLVFRRHAA
jgi:hypothetical protein